MCWNTIVFDWDGTLMDSTAHIVKAVRLAASDIGFLPPPPERVREVIGLGLRDAITRALPEIDDGQYARFVSAYRERFWADGHDELALFPGVSQVLEALRARGYRLAVATGKGRRGLDAALEMTKLVDMFDVTVCADEAHSKPHPAMLEYIMTALDIGARELLMVGDTDYDLEMAANAGADALGVTYGAHPPERLRRCAPLVLLDDIRELPAWLDSAGQRSGQDEPGTA